jgi:hypothetical protein
MSTVKNLHCYEIHGFDQKYNREIAEAVEYKFSQFFTKAAVACYYESFVRDRLISEYGLTWRYLHYLLLYSDDNEKSEYSNSKENNKACETVLFELEDYFSFKQYKIDSRFPCPKLFKFNPNQTLDFVSNIYQPYKHSHMCVSDKGIFNYIFN